eukprot:6176387-Pleurochrysis_carterae.AAC.1
MHVQLLKASQRLVIRRCCRRVKRMSRRFVIRHVADGSNACYKDVQLTYKALELITMCHVTKTYNAHAHAHANAHADAHAH